MSRGEPSTVELKSLTGAGWQRQARAFAKAFNARPAAAYPPEPTTDGEGHAHDPEACSACRRLADLFWAGGTKSESIRGAAEARQQGRDRTDRIEAAAARVLKLMEPLDRQAADGGDRPFVMTSETWRYNATPILAELRAALAGATGPGWRVSRDHRERNSFQTSRRRDCRMSRRNLIGVLARSLHEAVCQELVGPVPFEGEPDRIRAEMVLLRLVDNGYVVNETSDAGSGRSDPRAANVRTPDTGLPEGPDTVARERLAVFCDRLMGAIAIEHSASYGHALGFVGLGESWCQLCNVWKAATAPLSGQDPDGGPSEPNSVSP